ncbi:MAG TPA: LpqB family beta-propeller domain-containing protein [Vicinamibacterales bacterium]|nr:LpqB family beta-propeller domain-containing protein [Vicinamibacterales bacterium]
MRVSFGPFAFDRQSRLLWRDGAEVALPPRVLGVLELLIDRAGQVVARQDLLDAVWKDAFVTDTSLAEAVSFLRQALGDDPQSPRYIQTIHRRGYRFVAAVSGSDANPAAADAIGGRTPEQHVAVSSQPRAIPATPAAVKPSIAWQLLPWSIAILCAAAAAAALWRLTAGHPVPEPPPIARFELRPADGTSFDTRAPALAVSADGATLAWAACADDGAGCAVYVRRVDRLDPARLPGTDGASAPFFSPDGRWIGFFADGKLKKIPSAGGAPAILADAAVPGGAAWSGDGRIVFAGRPAGGLAVVPDQGGAVTALTSPRSERGELRHVHPAWLPGGALLFTIAASPLPDAPGELAVKPARTNDWKILRAGVTRATIAGPGYLLLSAGSDLQAATFDERTLALTGEADSVLASVTGGEGIAHFAIAGGTLVAATPPGMRTPLWSDGAGAAALSRLSSIAVAPDGRRVAGVLADGSGADVWIADLSSGALTRITYGGSNVSPAWSPDGTRLFFATRTNGPYTIASRAVGGGEAARVVRTAGAHAFPSSIAADGRIAITTVTGSGHTAAAIVPAAGGAPAILETGPFNERSPSLSPDGRWLALESDESGRTEIVARAVDGGARIPVSNGGGTRPQWSGDGRAIYYASGGTVIRAAVDLDGRSVRTRETIAARPGAQVLAVTSTGRALLAAAPATAGRALVVLQWLRELRQRLPLPVTAPK